MNYSDIENLKFRNKFEIKMSKLSDEKLEKVQKNIIRRICELEASTLDFYDYKKTIKDMENYENN